MDYVKFKLTLTDALNNTETDSVTIRFSQFRLTLADYFSYINQGDSVQLIHSFLGGIPPLAYSWTPNYNISDQNLEYPWVNPDTTTFYNCTVTDVVGCQSDEGDVYEVYVNSVGINESKNNTKIKLYPNPSSNYLIIENNGRQKDDLLIEIRDFTGKLALVKKVEKFENTTFNISELPAGIYFVNVKNEHGIITTKKWIKAE